MATTVIREKVIEEIQHMPEDKLDELYDLLHFFRIGLQQAPASSSDNAVMAFAGCWKDMADEEFDALLDDMTARRRRAFSGRPSRETITR